MSNKITSTEMFANELKNFISDRALRDKELKSIAKAIDYKLSVFKPTNRLKLSIELVYLNTFLGSIILRQSFSQSEFTSETVDEIIEIFVNNLLLQWIHKSYEPVEYYKSNRLNKWERLLKDLDSSDQIMNDFKILTDSFYTDLTNKQINPIFISMLTIRFNRYLFIYADYILQMIDNFELEE